MKNYLFIALTIIGLISCGKNYTVNEKIEMESEAWSHSNQLDFTMSVLDTSKRFNIYLVIDHSTMYSYQNIYMNVFTKYPSGKTLSQQLNIDLAEKDGKWKGKCKGENCITQIVLQENAYFNELGTHTFGFEQYTRDDDLQGINSIAFRVEKR